jgi:C4-dicarboxylate transporter/malic acid transport protein
MDTEPTTAPTRVPIAAAPETAGPGTVRRGFLRDLERPRRVWADLTPNWFASVMGTGIVAVAAASLPEQFPGLRSAATGVWALAAVMLIALSVLTALHWRHHPATARGHANDAVMGHFYGAVPMAMLTVGAGTLLLGRDWIGARAAIDADRVLWLAGTAGGLVCAAAIPYLLFTRHQTAPDSAFGGWLMPIVPPMVSASTGALLIPYTHSGQERLTLLVSCYAMFGLSLVPSIVIITLIWHRLAVHKAGPARMVPTLWIVLGPLGQSVTAANLLGGNAHLVLPSPYAAAFEAFGLVYGIPVLGFALLWAAIATAVTVRTAFEHLPFSLTWWSFTFPIGTCVTGTTGLAAHTGSAVLRIAAGVFYLVLVGAWMLVAARTARGAYRGRLFLPAEASPASS